jgi:hypothetical protein
MESPNTRVVNESTQVTKDGETKNPRKPELASKVVNPLKRVLAPPFYRETKGLLHSEIALESREYSLCEHVHECLLHPVICGANFIHLQVCH